MMTSRHLRQRSSHLRWRKNLESRTFRAIRYATVSNTPRFGKSIAIFGLRIHRSKPSCENSRRIADVAI